jgi:hypothetical protein
MSNAWIDEHAQLLEHPHDRAIASAARSSGVAGSRCASESLRGSSNAPSSSRQDAAPIAV